ELHERRLQRQHLLREPQLQLGRVHRLAQQACARFPTLVFRSPGHPSSALRVRTRITLVMTNWEGKTLSGSGKNLCGRFCAVQRRQGNCRKEKGGGNARRLLGEESDPDYPPRPIATDAKGP